MRGRALALEPTAHIGFALLAPDEKVAVIVDPSRELFHERNQRIELHRRTEREPLSAETRRDHGAPLAGSDCTWTWRPQALEVAEIRVGSGVR